MAFSDWLLQTKPLMPVIVLDSVEQAKPLAEALIAGGVNFLEVTLRTEAGLPAIEYLRQQVPDAIVGAGTITTPDEMTKAYDAGAQFAISPGITAELCKQAQTLALPFMPGVMTPSEIMIGLEQGVTAFKFYPAELAGGQPMLKALAGPFPYIRFCPTGGINADNAHSYLAMPNVDLIGGSWICASDLVQGHEWAKITALCQAFQA